MEFKQGLLLSVMLHSQTYFISISYVRAMGVWVCVMRQLPRSGSGGCSDTLLTGRVAKWLSANMAAQDELSKFLSALFVFNISLKCRAGVRQTHTGQRTSFILTTVVFLKSRRSSFVF